MTDLASNGTPMDELTMEDWETPYGPGWKTLYVVGKFDTVAAEKIWSWTLDSGQDDDCGNSVDWHSWSAWFAAPGTEDLPGGPMGGGVIIRELSGGHVSAERFGTRSGCARTWKSLVNEWIEYRHSDCEDGTDCEGCPSCDNI